MLFLGYFSGETLENSVVQTAVSAENEDYHKERGKDVTSRF